MIKELLVPYYVPDNDKKRFGKNSDGGYVVISKFLDFEEILSLGCNNETSFEEDLLSWCPSAHCSIYDRSGRCDLENKNSRVTFIKQEVKSVDTLINTNLNTLIQMDIEGAEFDVLNKYSGSFEKITQMLIEFHFLSYNKEDIIVEVLKKINKYFYLVHIHGNNHRGVTKYSPVPDVVECTYLNKNLCKLTELETRSFPVDKIDFKNNLNKPELKLNWWNKQNIN